jgi:hypothetical protein
LAVELLAVELLAVELLLKELLELLRLFGNYIYKSAFKNDFIL